MPTPVHARIERIQDGSVFLITGDGQSIHLPENAFQGTPVPGAEIRLFALLTPFEGTSDAVFAQNILNELLGTNP
jgi:hypothetical protein